MPLFLAFIRKEFYHIFRDRWTVIILLLLPVVMLVLFGYALTTEVKDTDVAVLDPARDTATRAIIEQLDASEYFNVVRYLSGNDDIEAVFRGGRTGLAVVFSPNFKERLSRGSDAAVQLIVDGTDPNTASAVASYAENILAAYEDAPGGPVIRAEVRLLYNPGMKSAYNFVPGVMGMILLMICAMMTSVSIAREKEKGTMEVLLVSPVRPVIIILAKAVPYLLLSVLNLATILALSVYVLGVPIAGSLATLLLVSFWYIFLSLSLGLLISAAVDSQLVALLISGMALIMPVIMLSGMIFPIESMPAPLQMVSRVVPASWYIAAVRKIMIMGLGFGDVVTEMLILAGVTAVLLGLSLSRFKSRLE